MDINSKIYVSGHRGMVGSAVIRLLKSKGYNNIVTTEWDLREQNLVNSFFLEHRPEYVFHVAGKVGGIKANNEKSGEFIYDNTMIASNVINTSFKAGVKKLLYVGSSCIYPKNCPQPIKEEYFLSGDLEKTNEGYAIAKIAGIKLCQSYRKQYGANFICAMPTNSYGQNDKYDLENSHVLPAIIRKILEAKKSGSNKIELWGTGKPLREFIHVDDMADAILFLMLNYDGEEIVNVGTGEEVSISDLCGVIKKCADWDGEAVFNGNLDGTMRKILDCSKINSMGWQHKINLENGIKETLNDAEKYIDIWLPQS